MLSGAAGRGVGGASGSSAAGSGAAGSGTVGSGAVGSGAAGSGAAGSGAAGVGSGGAQSGGAPTSLHVQDGGAPKPSLLHVPPPADLPIVMGGHAGDPLPGGFAIQPHVKFLDNFRNFSGGAFNSFTSGDWAGIILAGDRRRWRTTPDSDVEIFLLAPTEAAARAKMRAACNHPSIARGGTFLRTPHTVTVCSPQRRNVQVILHVYGDVTAILSDFDVDAPLNGTNVVGLERAKRALATRVNLVDRGFAIGVPGLDRARARIGETLRCMWRECVMLKHAELDALKVEEERTRYQSRHRAQEHWFAALDIDDYGTRFPSWLPLTSLYDAFKSVDELLAASQHGVFFESAIGKGEFDAQDWERGLYPPPEDEVVQPEGCLKLEELAAVAEAD
ncbi:hypothetical protein T492DRAFT_863222 [Pavlovales sp. CCMP2436]|nr:hypothetical protein T492DRAFT_863222 [Pavlovales sp. CCMP2436]